MIVKIPGILFYFSQFWFINRTQYAEAKQHLITGAVMHKRGLTTGQHEE